MGQLAHDWIGRTLSRTYLVEQLLGRGGMGVVYRVRHLRTGGHFAVKILHREAAADPEIYKRFQDEARTASALRHPHIVQVTDFDQEVDGTPFMVMELLDGEDLHQRLRRVGRLPLPVVLELARQIGSALQAAHDSGVVHRDIKPQNIFLARHRLGEEWGEVAKVVDFGISKIRHNESQITQENTILGTPHFMSPEVARGRNLDLDGRADQFSLALILYRALAGRLAFDGADMVSVLYQVVHERPPSLSGLCPDTPRHVVEAVDRAMNKERDGRFPDMMSFVRTLGGQPLSASGSLPSPTPVPPASATTLPEMGPTTTLSAATGHSMQPRRRRRLAVVAAGLAVSGLLTLAILARGPLRVAPPEPRATAPLPVLSPPPAEVPDLRVAAAEPVLPPLRMATPAVPPVARGADKHPRLRPPGMGIKTPDGKRGSGKRLRPVTEPQRRPHLDPGL